MTELLKNPLRYGIFRAAFIAMNDSALNLSFVQVSYLQAWTKEYAGIEKTYINLPIVHLLISSTARFSAIKLINVIRMAVKFQN